VCSCEEVCIAASVYVRDHPALAAAWCRSALQLKQLSGPFRLNIVKCDPELTIMSSIRVSRSNSYPLASRQGHCHICVYMVLSVIYIIRHVPLLLHVELCIFYHVPIIMNIHMHIHSTYMHILLALAGKQLLCFTGTRYSMEHNYHNGQRWQSQRLTRMLDLMVSPGSCLTIFRRNGPESCFSRGADPHHAAASGGLSSTYTEAAIHTSSHEHTQVSWV